MTLYRFLSIACLVAACATAAAYAGACATLVPGDSGGAREVPMLVACVVAGIFCVVFRRLDRSGRAS